MATAYYSEETLAPAPPTTTQICLVRFTWERVSTLRLPTDEQTVSPPQAFCNEFYDALFALDSDAKRVFFGVVLKAQVLTGILSFITRSPTVLIRSKFASIREINANHRISMTTNDNSSKKKSLVDMAREAAELEEKENGQEEKNKKKEEQEEEEKQDFANRLYALGAQHASLNVQPYMLDLVGPALLAALRNRLGNEYVPEIGEAWIKVQ